MSNDQSPVSSPVSSSPVNNPAPLVLVTDDRDSSFTFTPMDDNGREYGSVLHLRMVPDDVQESLRKKHTRRQMKKGVWREDLNGPAYAQDVLDYAVVGWEGVRGVKMADGGKRVSFDLECTRVNKLRLPDRLQTEIYRMCHNREVDELVQAETEAPND